MDDQASAAIGDPPSAICKYRSTWATQKLYFRASWITLGLSAVVILPNDGDVMFACGFPKFAILNPLKKSARKSRWDGLSLPIGNDLDIEKSKFLISRTHLRVPPRVSKRSQSIWREGLRVKPFGKFFTSGAVATAGVDYQQDPHDQVRSLSLNDPDLR